MNGALKTYLVRVPNIDLEAYHNELGGSAGKIKPHDLLDAYFWDKKKSVMDIITAFAEAGAVLVDRGYASQTLSVTLPESARAQVAALEGFRLIEISPPPAP